MDEKVYTIKNAAQKVKYSERQLRQKCIEGKMPDAYKIPAGRKWLIPEHSIKAFSKNLEAQSIIKTQQNRSVAAGTKQDVYGEKPVFTLDSKENANLVALGARVIRMAELESSFWMSPLTAEGREKHGREQT